MGDVVRNYALDERDGIGEVLGGSLSSLGVVRLHAGGQSDFFMWGKLCSCDSHLDLDTEDTLSEEDVSDGVVDKVTGGLTRVDHETVGELHGLGSGGTELSRDDDLATLGARLHDESEDTVTGSSHGETTEELVSEGLGLGDGGQTSELDLLGVELEGSLGELESLLDEGLELSDSSSLVTEDLLGVGRSDDDLGSGVGHSDLAARVSLLGELSGAGLGQGEF
jgi:hypothetical protein